MQRGDEIEVPVTRLSYGGDALAEAPDGRVVFVRGAAPGARVRVTLTQVRRRYLRGRIEAVVAPAGVEPFCPHVDRCGGCPWQRAPVEVQREALHAHLTRALSQAAGAPVTVAPPPPTADRAWRSTARLHWRDGTIGFHGEGSQEVVPIDACPVLAPPLDALLTAVRTHLAGALGDRGTLRLSAAPGAASGTVAVHPASNAGRKRCLNGVRALLGDPACHGAIVLWPDGRRDPMGVPENVLGPAAVVHPAEAFVQAHQPGVAALVADVVAALAGARAVVEWYAGAGNFSVALAAAGIAVTPVEQVPAAAAALRARIPGTVTGDAAQASTAGYDALLLDPPRAGAADALAKLHPGLERVVYVSCDFATLARDVGALVGAGWRVADARLYDLFPHTGRGEALVVLRR